MPVLVLNNEPGRDAELLELYREPAWNNPVVRFFAPGGRELLARADGVYAADALAERMGKALAEAKGSVPGYLELAREELAREPLERAVFAMHCFWRGEGVLGAIRGVRSTRAGHLDGHEVVEVEYSPARIPFADLLARARAGGCADRVWVEPGERLVAARSALGDGARELVTPPRPAAKSDHETYLRDSPCAFLPLTPLQRVRINAVLGSGHAPEGWLSPSQRALLERVKARRDALRGLEPPLVVSELWGYRTELEKRLAE